MHLASKNFHSYKIKLQNYNLKKKTVLVSLLSLVEGSYDIEGWGCLHRELRSKEEEGKRKGEKTIRYLLQ